MKLSILTATYNRAEYLPKLYKSIVSNIIDELEIEWLIMDDGSSDNTETLIRSFEIVHNLNIKYFKQENQGKMSAINNLMQYVTGEMVMDCDSDDYFVENAFKEIYNKKDILLNDNELYALVFLKNENKNLLSGNKFFKENIKTTMFNMYFKEGITGEKIIVFKTELRKKYKHELESGERFITEARMYHKMDLNYFVKCFNIVISEGEYLQDGYTTNIIKTFKQSPVGYFNYFKEMFNMNQKNIILNKRLYIIKHYILFEFLTNSNINIKNVKGLINKILYLVLVIPGRIKTKKMFC